MVGLDLYCAALRTDRHKLIIDERRPERIEIFNLDLDPGETRNINGSQPDVEANLRAVFAGHLHRIRASGGRDANGAWEREAGVEQRLQALGYIE